jgi:hypothetical protein
LFCVPINNRLGNLRRLPWAKRSSLRTISRFGLKGFVTSLPVCLDRFANSITGDPKKYLQVSFVHITFV